MKCVSLAVLALATLGVVEASSGSGSGTEPPIVCPAIGCSSENPKDPVCGTDGVTYENSCELSIACKRVKPELAYKGPCSTTGSGSGSAKPPTNGTEEAGPTAPKVPAPAPSRTMSGANSLVVSAGLSAAAVVVTVAALM